MAFLPNFDSAFMSWNDFIRYCEDFLVKSNNLNDGWKFCHKGDNIGESYLLKTTMKYLNFVSDSDFSSLNIHNISQWEYHILFSSSYSVPVLYFNVWKRDGSILSLDEIYRLQGADDKYSKAFVISQQQHPVIHRPFYFIHPCDTVTILQSCKSVISSETATSINVNPIILWLSTISSSVCLELSSKYACHVDSMKNKDSIDTVVLKQEKE